MKVFLGNSPWSKKGYYGVRAGSRWPHFESDKTEYMPFPFFLAYAAAVLEKNDFDVLAVDGIAEKINQEEFIKRMVDYQPDLVLSEVSTISIDVDLALAKALRKRLGPSVKIALSGLHSFMYEKDFLEKYSFVDYVLIGEYEYTLLDLARHLKEGRELKDVLGLTYRDEKGVVQINSRRPVIENLDELPWPARHFLPMHNYCDEPGSMPRPSVQMWASRGCPFKCIFCAWPQIMYGSNKYRARDPILVVDELEWLVQKGGFKSVYFDDDTFNLGKTRVLRFCQELKMRGLNVPWAVMARADTMDREMLEAMADAGLWAVKYGIESAEQSILDRGGKSLDINRAIDMVKITKGMGIKVHLTFMFGLPGETKQTVRKTIALALALDPYSLQFSIVTPFPGSRYYKMLEKEGRLLTKDWIKYDGYYTAVIRTEELSQKELEDFIRLANQLWERHCCHRKPFPEEKKAPVLASVVIPNWNGREMLKACLDSLRVQSLEDFEVIVVDNGSSDDSVPFVKKHYPEARIIQLDVNKGFARAVNEGIEHSRGRYIALLNNDTKVDPDWLKELVLSLEGHPEVGFCAAKILNLQNPNIIDGAGDGITRSGYTFKIGNGCKDGGEYDSLREVFGACAAAAIYRRSMFNDIGLFDEDFVSYLEDMDISFRAQLWGYRCLYVPTAIAYHRGSASTGKMYNKTTTYLISRNTINLIVKDVPRKIIRSNYLGIMGLLLKLQIYHLLRTSCGIAYFRGILAGLRQFKRTVLKRKRVLGGRRVPDARIYDLMIESEKQLKDFKKRR